MIFIVYKRKDKFHHCKNLILLKDVDIDDILISSTVPSGKINHK